MRLRMFAPFAPFALLCLALAAPDAHADTLSVFRLKNQAGAGNVGTVTVDTTTGKITGLDVSLTLAAVTDTFDVAPVSQMFSPYVNAYVATFSQGGDEFLLEIPQALSLVDFDPASSGKCKTQAAFCDYLANVYNGPVSSANLVSTFEGNLALASTTTTTPATGVTPEPSSIALLGTGLLAAAGVMRRRMA